MAMLRGVVRVRRVVRPPRAEKKTSTNTKLLKQMKGNYLLNLLLKGMIILIARPSET
jgi:hypothetical protein